MLFKRDQSFADGIDAVTVELWIGGPVGIGRVLTLKDAGGVELLTIEIASAAPPPAARLVRRPVRWAKETRAR